jgi:hypothetical protein
MAAIHEIGMCLDSCISEIMWMFLHDEQYFFPTANVLQQTPCRSVPHPKHGASEKPEKSKIRPRRPKWPMYLQKTPYAACLRMLNSSFAQYAVSDFIDTYKSRTARIRRTLARASLVRFCNTMCHISDMSR